MHKARNEERLVFCFCGASGSDSCHAGFLCGFDDGGGYHGSYALVKGGFAGWYPNKEISELAAAGDERAQLVVNMYAHQITKFVGSYVAAMGGADAIVFTGGIGENAGEYRTKVCEKLAFMGVKIDAEKNKIRGEEVEISTPDSTVKVFVIPTNEELVIARDTLEIVSALKA